MKYINSKIPITRRYGDTSQNPEDIGCRESNDNNSRKEWWDGSRWLVYPEHDPVQKEITATKIWKRIQDENGIHMYSNREIRRN